MALIEKSQECAMTRSEAVVIVVIVVVNAALEVFVTPAFLIAALVATAYWVLS